jgi:L-malate glycosyltransferase
MSMAVANPSEYLIVLPWSINGLGGVNQVVRNLYRQFQEGDAFEPAILQSDWNPEQVKVEGDWRVIPIRLRSPWDERHRWKAVAAFFIYLPGSLARLRSIFASGNVEVVNPHFPDLSAIQFVVMKKLGLFHGPLLLSFHLSDVGLVEQTTGMERRLWRILFSGCDRVVSCSNELGNRLKALIPGLESKVVTVWNGIDAAKFEDTDIAAADVAAIMEKRPYLLCVAAFEPKKAHDVLLSAYKTIRVSFPEVRLVLIGQPGKASESVKAALASGDFGDSVTLLENVPHTEIAEWMKAAELITLPSRAEGFPIAILEAGACGKAIVATPVGGVPEIIRDGETGRLVRVDNSDDLATAITTLLKSPAERRRLGRNLQSLVKSEFTWRNAHDRYVSICKEITERS